METERTVQSRIPLTSQMQEYLNELTESGKELDVDEFAKLFTPKPPDLTGYYKAIDTMQNIHLKRSIPPEERVKRKSKSKQAKNSRKTNRRR